MTTIRGRFANIAVAAVIGTFVFALGVLTGHMTTHHTAPAATTSVSTATTDVDQFNDGYATAYQDMCQQGSAVACAWLKAN